MVSALPKHGLETLHRPLAGRLEVDRINCLLGQRWKNGPVSLVFFIWYSKIVFGRLGFTWVTLPFTTGIKTHPASVHVVPISWFKNRKMGVWNPIGPCSSSHYNVVGCHEKKKKSSRAHVPRIRGLHHAAIVRLSKFKDNHSQSVPPLEIRPHTETFTKSYQKKKGSNNIALVSENETCLWINCILFFFHSSCLRFARTVKKVNCGWRDSNRQL